MSPRGASPWTGPGCSQDSSRVCSEGASGLEPLGKKRGEREEEGGAKGWLLLRRLAPPGAGKAARGGAGQDLGRESEYSGRAREKGKSLPRASVPLRGSRMYKRGLGSGSVCV